MLQTTSQTGFAPEDCDPVTLSPGSAYPSGIPDPIGGRVLRRLSKRAGLSNVAVVHVELPPGSALSLRLWQTREEEFFYVLSGEVTLITDAGEETLTAGCCAGFPAGDGNGHQLINRGSTPAMLLEIADLVEGNETHYSDHDLHAVIRDGKRIFVNGDGQPYQMG